MKDNIFKTMLDSKRVNNYAKMLILLNNYDYYKDYYIPNKKIEKAINISNRFIREILKQLEKDKIIYLYYKKSKRFFRFINNEKIERKRPDIFEYDWLNED